MAKIITENFRVETANEFFNSFRTVNDNVSDDFRDRVESYNVVNSLGLSNTNIDIFQGYADDILSEVNPENRYYLFASSIDSDTTIANTQKEKREFLRRVIFGRRIITDNIKYIFTNVKWTTGVVYDSFDDEQDIQTLNMFVTVLDGDEGEGPYKVFKCIRNNEGAVSTVEPSTSDLDVNNETTLSDGYVWKYMFDVPAGEYTEYATATGLPYIANNNVVDSTEETVSDIRITLAAPSQFSDYIIGTANTSTNTIDPVRIDSVVTDDSTENTYAITITTVNDARNTEGAYIGMYLRIINPGQAEAVYDILNSEVPDGSPRTLILYVKSDIDLTDISPGLPGKFCDIVPKINVSRSTGDPCVAFGELDQEGTLTYVHFVDKGTQYKYATAELSLPEAIQDTEGETVLRAIVSPIGGHGSDPISEMYMSRVSVVSNFFTSSLNNIPDTNTYTKVGLIKNPSFFDGSFPDSFDNRLAITVNGDITNSVSQNDYLEQVVNGEVVVSRVHETSYNANTNVTTLYVADHDGAHANTFEPGNAVSKQSLDDTESEAVTINSVSDKQYLAFTGDLLHFIDFDPIERQADRKEKIKLVFDF